MAKTPQKEERNRLGVSHAGLFHEGRKPLRYRTRIQEVEQLPVAERERLGAVTDEYAFRVNDYYLSLIDWNDPDDPIRRIVIPSVEELGEYGGLDPSDEASNYVARACQHKYAPTALLMVSNRCNSHCRFCFRKRLFREGGAGEANLDLSEGIAYISAHPEITNVLLTGGDPLVLSSHRLDQILTALRAIPHVRVIRIGTKLPAFEPMRITGDPGLLDVLSRHSLPEARVYIVAQFNHPRELTEQATHCIAALARAGLILVGQTPLLRGVNDDPAVLGELLERLSMTGVTPYYVFQNRPVAGNAGFVVPLGRAYAVVETAKAKASGLAKRVRLAMSHAKGKIEVLAVEGDRIYLKYHEARNPADYGRLLVRRLPEGAAWFDDLEPEQTETSRSPG